MIVRFEQSPESLLIESRVTVGWSRLRPFIVALSVVVVFTAGMFLALGWMSARAGVPFGATSSPRFIGSVAAAAALAVVFGAWLVGARERLTLHGSELSYERFIGPVRTLAQRLDLLAARGLRFGAADPAADHAPVDATLGPTMALWYNGEPFTFGHTFDASDRARVAEALLDHDAAFRARLGLPPEAGLRDEAVWTRERTLALGPAAGTRFTGKYFNKMRDFDK